MAKVTSHILLVKNQDPDREHIVEALDRLTEGGEAPVVVTACDSREALHHLNEGAFDLVISDLVLPKPGLSGAETLIRAGELHPAARTLLFSEHGCVRDLVEGTVNVFLDLERGLEAFLTELASQVGDLLASPGGNLRLIDDVTTFASSGDGSRPAGAECPKLIAAKYQLSRELGRGGMGVVYRAEDTFIGRPVAVKLLRVQTRQSQDGLVRRMRREVRIAGRLAHPNIVTIFDAGFHGDDMYFVMELIEGKNLRQLLRQQGRLEREKAIDIVLQTLGAVCHAHSHQVVHRDLKPENILLTPTGKVKVVDFGVAKIVSMASSSDAPREPRAEGRVHTTARGAVVGTRGYMAPEQLTGDPVDHRADLYALGAVLYEMLRGQPLAGPGSRSTGATPGLDKAASLHLPGEPQLARILQKALALLPDHRYRDGEEFAAALESLADPSWKRLLFWR